MRNVVTEGIHDKRVGQPGGFGCGDGPDAVCDVTFTVTAIEQNPPCPGAPPSGMRLLRIEVDAQAPLAFQYEPPATALLLSHWAIETADGKMQYNLQMVDACSPDPGVFVGPLPPLPIPATAWWSSRRPAPPGYGWNMRRRRIAGRCGHPCERRPRCDEFCPRRLSYRHEESHGRTVRRARRRCRGAGPMALPVLQREMGAAVGGQLGAADTILLGRKTYDSFAGAWPDREAGGDEDAEFAKKLGDTRKIVVSRENLQFTWRNSDQIKGDLAEAVTALKNEPGGDIGMSGSVSVVRQLLAVGLLDELHLLVHPVAVGKGMRLFDEGDSIPLKLLSSQTFKRECCTSSTHRPTHPPRPAMTKPRLTCPKAIAISAAAQASRRP